MIEYYLNTGVEDDSDNYYRNTQLSNASVFIDSNNKFINQVYADGQTLLEDDVTETSLSTSIKTYTHSGDFYIDSFSLKNSGDYYNFEGIETVNYDIMQSGKRPFFESDNFNNLLNGFANKIAGQVSGDLFFINGIKLISGIHYYVHNGIFEWNDGNPTSLELSGIMFSMPNNFDVIITGQYDIYNQNFKIGTTVAYLNGVRLYQDDLLETSTINTLINTGIEAKIRFSPKRQEQIIFF
jgi:hypothetical protein